MPGVTGPTGPVSFHILSVSICFVVLAGEGARYQSLGETAKGGEEPSGGEHCGDHIRQTATQRLPQWRLLFTWGM